MEENILFEKTAVPKAYMTLALPVVLSMLVSLVYNMIDTWFIALTGNADLVAGVSLAAPIFTMLIAFGDIFGLGGSSLISRLMGEKKDREVRQVSAFCFWSAIIFGLAVTVVLLIFRNPILQLLGADETTVQYAGAYYTWISAGAVCVILELVPSNILRTEGLSRHTMIGSVTGTIVNIILDPIFIFTLHLGAAGAAIATVLAHVVTIIYYIYAMRTFSKKLSYSVRDIRIDGKMPSMQTVRWILAIGIPASVTNLMQSFMMMITNKALLPYGTNQIAAMGIAMKANMISSMALVGFAFGGQPLVGYNYGSGNAKRLKEVLRFAYSFITILAAALSILVMVLAPFIIRLFMDDPEIVATGARMLRFQQIGMVFMAVCLASICVCQSVGNAFGALILSISRQGLIYAAVLVILSHTIGYTGILISQAVSDTLTAVLAVLLMLRFFKRNVISGGTS